MKASMKSPGMMLTDLLAEANCVDRVPPIQVQDISSNSKQVVKGAVFVALPGINSNGIDYAIDAVKAGAVAVLFDANDAYSLKRVPMLRKQVLSHWIGVENLNQANGFIVSRYYGNPGAAMIIVGVTGTDGKSSVTHLLTQALTNLGAQCGSIGTLGHGINNDLTVDALTTPDAVSLQSRLYQYQQQACEYVVMEVSSHALQQYRVNGCDFDIAVLTNLGRDHLDYHGNLENYAAAKSRLFHDFDLSASVVNADDDFGEQLGKGLSQDSVLRYSINIGSADQATIKLIEAELTSNGQNFRAQTPLGEVSARTSLIGEFNQSNVLACIATLVALGFNRGQIQRAVQNLQPIPGRMEKFEASSRIASALVDFAHTEQALRACLEACRLHTQGKIWCVFGCGGDRDPGKRPGMGRVAEELANHVIITDDNPRNESPQKIVSDILLGLQMPTEVSVVHNRKAAIEFAMSQAAAEDLVVICGKGHEQEQIIGHERRPFSDRHVVSQILQLIDD